MALVRHFEEHDFYSSSEEDEDFRKYLSDFEDEENENEKEWGLENIMDDSSPMKENTQSEFECKETNINENTESKDETENPVVQVDSLLDCLLSDAFSESSDVTKSKKTDDIVSELENSDEERLFVTDKDHAQYEDVETHENSNYVENVYLEMKNDEEQISMEDIPDFASKRNIYGTCFNVSSGIVIRPHKIDYARKDSIWIKLSQATTHDSSFTISQILENRKKSSPLNYGEKINTVCRFTNVFTKTAEEVIKMETRDFQIIIRDAFNTKRLAVILLGVDKENRVTGCCMPMRDQDNLCLALDTTFQTEFVPRIENVLDVADIKFIRVENSEEKDRFLVVIRIKQLRNQVYELESDLNVA